MVVRVCARVCVCVCVGFLFALQISGVFLHDHICPQFFGKSGDFPAIAP